MESRILEILDTPIGQWTGWHLINAWFVWCVVRLFAAACWAIILTALGIELPE
jgi:hypothetical protein